MNFYQELSEVYDIVFPENQETINFLNKDLSPNAYILDIACGTGGCALALGNIGHRVVGIDLDKSMLEIAKAKSKSPNVNFKECDMTKIGEQFYGEKFDLVYCIGNSIVHLQDKQKIQNLINEIYNKLTSQGTCIIQIINYDRIIDENITSLPTISREEQGVKFIRNYEYKREMDLVYFNTELIVEENGEDKHYENSVPLITLRSDELASMLKEAGFSNVDLFADFMFNTYTKGAYATIARAIK